MDTSNHGLCSDSTILLQLSAAQGPQECARAVALALAFIHAEAKQNDIKTKVVQQQQQSRDCLKSVLLQLQGNKAQVFAETWQGVMLWRCPSPYRPRHKRKNWFFSGQVYLLNHQQLDQAIQYRSCRASGAGGQHVNTTDSAVQATHIASGISVRVESERSQHANKRLARALIAQKLEEQQQLQMNAQEKQRWRQHWALERGNPVRVFNGPDFKPG